MAKKRKTKEQKIKSAYRLGNFKLQVARSQARRDVEEFSYLSKKYVRQDLTKTVVFTLLVVALLFITQRFLG